MAVPLKKRADGIITGADWDHLATDFLGEGRDRWTVSYVIYTDGTDVYAFNGVTGIIDYGGPNDNGGVDGADAAAVIQAAIDALDVGGGVGCRGSLYIKAWPNHEYEIGTTITPAQGNGYLMIEGDGIRNTILKWTGAAGEYVFDFDAVGYVHLRNFEIWGGETGVPVGHAARLRRDLPGESMTAKVEFVRASRCIDPAFYCDYLADSIWIEAQGSVGNLGYGLEAVNSSHLKMYGGLPVTLKINASLFTMYGGTLSHAVLEQAAPYATVLHGVYFDPVPVGYDSHLEVGTVDNVDNLLVESCTFRTATNLYNIDVDTSRGTVIRNCHFLRTGEVGVPATTINIQATADGTVVDAPYLQRNELARIADAGTDTKLGNLWTLENNGVAVMANGTAAIVVAHGLAGTPTVFSLAGEHAEVSALYVSAVGAVNFTTNKGTAGNTTGNRNINWKAKVL